MTEMNHVEFCMLDEGWEVCEKKLQNCRGLFVSAEPVRCLAVRQ